MEPELSFSGEFQSLVLVLRESESESWVVFVMQCGPDWIITWA